MTTRPRPASPATAKQIKAARLTAAGRGQAGADQPQRPDPLGVGAADAVGVVVGVVDPDLQGEADDQGEQRRPPGGSARRRRPAACRRAPARPRRAGSAAGRRRATAPGVGRGGPRSVIGRAPAIRLAGDQSPDRLAVGLAAGQPGQPLQRDQWPGGRRTRAASGRTSCCRSGELAAAVGHRDDLGAPLRVRDADHHRRRRRPSGPRPDQRLDRGQVDVQPAGDHHVVQPAEHLSRPSVQRPRSAVANRPSTRLAAVSVRVAAGSRRTASARRS